MRDRNGFTLVELLAVIVILAVVMLMAVTAVGPLMSRSRKGTLGTEGIELVNAAKMAYQSEQMTSNSAIKATSTVCFDMAWLYNKDYFAKGSGNAEGGDGYIGSVLAKYDTTTKKYSYLFWISNGTYYFYNSNTDQSGYDSAYDIGGEGPSSIENPETKLNNCGGQSSTSKYVYCTGTTCTRNN